MKIMFLLIGVSLFMAIGFLLAFVWTVKSGQMEDDYTPSVRILFEDKPVVIEEEPTIKPVENFKSDKNQF